MSWDDIAQEDPPALVTFETREAYALDVLIGRPAVALGSSAAWDAAVGVAMVTGAEARALLASYVRLLIERAHDVVGDPLSLLQRQALAERLEACEMLKLGELAGAWWRTLLDLRRRRTEPAAEARSEDAPTAPESIGDEDEDTSPRTRVH